MTEFNAESIVDIKNPWLRKSVVIWGYVVGVLLYVVATPFIYVVNYLWPSLQEAGHDIKQGFIELHTIMKTAWRGHGKI
jgi:hypothetical protein